ncbi:MAG TPA: SMC-Scp complex subunit ScpB [Acidimicrobiia bacterium]|nr:SMC-Scp complex subunit ScpB [Acidimicrobiia bacterium]
MTDVDDVTELDLELRRAIEAIVLAATEPVPPTVLAQLLEVSVARIDDTCAALAADYEREQRGFVLARVAGGYRYQTHPDAAPYLERFVLEGQHSRLSGPALETLAIIAYKQPISRAQLSAIRGVNVDATLRTLVARGYVEEIGHEPTPGNPSLFGTTGTFLERLGLDTLDELPPLGDFVPGAHVVEALERGLRITDQPTLDDAADDDAAAEVADASDASAVEASAVVDVTGDDGPDLDVVAELRAGLDPDAPPDA